jgi:hypothetical protein
VGDLNLAPVSLATLATIPQLANYLISGFWQYEGVIAHHWPSNTISYNLGNLSASEKTLALSALNSWHDVANISFVATIGAANISFSHNGTMTAEANGVMNSNGEMTSASVNISADWITSDGGTRDGRTGIYSYGYQTYLHEIGHVLGLGHQGPYNGKATYGVDNIFTNDTWKYSIMSYFGQSNYDGGRYDYVITPQMADITAIQTIYGAPAATRTHDTTYGFHSSAGSIYDFTQYAGLGTPALTIYDDGGSDTLDASDYTMNQKIDLTPGGFSSIGGYANDIGIFTTTVVEAAIGGRGSDTLIGNNADNFLTGGAGNDNLQGGGGNDTALYRGAASSYRVTLLSSGNYTVVGLDGTDQLSSIEYLQFGASPSALIDSLLSAVFSLVATNANRSEGNSGNTPFTFTVTRSGATTAAADVRWAVIGSGASPATASDFTGNVLPSGIVSFTAGEASKVITIGVAGDTTLEPNEGFTVTLFSIYASDTIATGSASGTIVNDDSLLSAVFSLVATNANRSEGNSGSTPFTFTVTRSGATTAAADVRWAVIGSGARPAMASDFTGNVLPSGTVSFTAGEASKVITIGLAGDTTLEPNEGFTVTLSSPSAGGTIATGSASGTIVNDDASSLTHGCFDSVYYLATNADVAKAGVDAYQHYELYGWHEGRDPDAFFSTTGYLGANQDVKAAGIDPLQHYDQYGWKEGRDPSASFDTTLYLLHNPDVRVAGIDPLLHYDEYGQAEGRMAFAAVGKSITHGGFDAEYYLLANPDVAKADVDAYQHYEQYGWHEGRDPNAFFSTISYLTTNLDVKAAGIDPLQHYDQYGWKEGRNPSPTFSTSGYLALNPDVKAAGIDPLVHYERYGIFEGRGFSS